MDDWYDAFGVAFHWDSYSAAVDAGWAKAGITCVSRAGGNRYYYENKEIRDYEAHDILKAKFPKIRSANTFLSPA